MEGLILNADLETVGILDIYESLIWTDRYCGFGDFEIYTPVSIEALNSLKKDYYIWSMESNMVMIIEDREIDFNNEDGHRLSITGRSLESILERRIIWNPTVLTGNFQNGIETLLNENIISPTDTDRQISNFIFEVSTDPVITALTIDSQYNGENLYDVIHTLCSTNNLGFSITLTDDNKFKFQLYYGKDRSYDQTANTYVIFSPSFENLISGNYIESTKLLKTISLVEGVNNKKIAVETASGQIGISRREIYTDAKDLSDVIDDVPLTTEEYDSQLAQRGAEQLSEAIFVNSFEGQVESNQSFKYDEDFFIGDIVQITNEYGIESKSRVIEVVHSTNLSGKSIYPTFSTVI